MTYDNVLLSASIDLPWERRILMIVQTPSHFPFAIVFNVWRGYMIFFFLSYSRLNTDRQKRELFFFFFKAVIGEVWPALTEAKHTSPATNSQTILFTPCWVGKQNKKKQSEGERDRKKRKKTRLFLSLMYWWVDDSDSWSLWYNWGDKLIITHTCPQYENSISIWTTDDKTHMRERGIIYCVSSSPDSTTDTAENIIIIDTFFYVCVQMNLKQQ